MRAETQRISANGLSHFVRDTGEIDAPAAIMLHGFPDSSAVWTKVTPLLVNAGFRVIAPDLRGFGETDMAASVAGYDIQNGAFKDVLAIMDALKIEVAHIAGHDFGAPVAWMLAAQRPERFKTLTAISVGHTRAYLNAGWEQKWRSTYILFHQVRGLCEAAYRANDWALLRRHWSRHGDIEDAIHLLSRPGRLTAGLNWYRANISLDRILKPPRVGTFGEEIVRIPTLGIWSDGEAYLTEAQMMGSEDYVDAPWRYERIEGASHWISYDAPDALARLMISHWREYA
ncbi:alpha/beta fold hydrolase [Hyphococcus sp.]|jgi:pimeloyl-ACP methyl ester carboxylesterase|uniref:alpha/beta fold hydrolase n=1 Tax=Hyphococcus sp. TaxID=2038636 RepID=UPI003D0B4855